MSQISLPISIETRGRGAQHSRADRLTRAAFNALASLPIPDHLIDLVNELDVALAGGGLRAATHAA
jgi:hypothetical protein